MVVDSTRGEVVPLVVLAGRGLDWAIEARSVLNAHLAAEWKGPPPVDIAALWGVRWAEEDSNAARVVVVVTRSGVRAFSSVRLSFRSVDRNNIFPLPHVLARGWGGKVIRGVVFSEQGPALLVLDPDAFVDEPNPVLSDSLPRMRA
jgi:hypothetical protein